MNQKDTDLIIDRINSLHGELYNLLRDLIRIKSYSGHEKEIVEFIINQMDLKQFDEKYIDKFGNAVGRVGNGPVTIMYDAHVDTVEVTESEKWVYPPFEGRIENGKIYGRGAVDEKPAMAGFVIAAGVLKKIGLPLPFTLYIVGSVLEEDCDGYPLLHIIEKEKIIPDFVLLGEPTDLRVYRGQRGRMEFEIEATGQSAHGAHNHKGINAIYKLAPLISELEKYDLELPVEEPLGKGSLTVSEISSKAPSLCSVPDQARIHIDRRLTVSESKEKATNELDQLIQKMQIDAKISIPKYKGQSWKGHKFEQDAYFPTWITDEDHVLVKAAVNTATLTGGKADQTGFWQFSTNGVATAGRLGIPTIGYAPGREELAHTAEEESVLEDLLIATRFYAVFPFLLSMMVGE
jgi:putative selenium metabolism hydrolase